MNNSFWCFLTFQWLIFYLHTIFLTHFFGLHSLVKIYTYRYGWVLIGGMDSIPCQQRKCDVCHAYA